MGRFANIIRQSTNPVAASMLFVLAWIAGSDGEVSHEERESLRIIAESGSDGDRLSQVIDLAIHPNLRDIQLACEILRGLEHTNRRMMLEMAIGMALEDRYLTTTEGHIIRFLADVFEFPTEVLDRLFVEMTGERFPPPSDISSVEWWERRESRSRSSNSRHDGSSSGEGPQHSPGPSMQRLKDLGLLGLDEDCSRDQIKEAYRRLAKIHHPDKFASLGAEAVQAAELTFQRIHAAYERLVVS